MKRYTLCKLSLCVLFLTGMIIWLWYLPEIFGNEEEKFSGGAVCLEEPVFAEGTVSGIEEKETWYHQKQYVISLKAVTFCNGNFQKQKNQIENRASGQGRAEGILCYLKAGEALSGEAFSEEASEWENCPRYGERIVVWGEAEQFEKSRNPGCFDAALYYQTKGIEFCLKNAELIRRDGKCQEASQKFYELRCYLGRILEQVCGEDAGVMKSLLLGDKTLLSRETKGLYQNGGISHILAISGLHISFLGAGIYRFLKKLWVPGRVAAVIAAGLLLTYVVMAGATPSACRAAMMFLFCLLADMLRRSYERKTALACAALIQIIQSPMTLCQSGFWLSYGAVLGLAVVAPVLEGLWKGKAGRLFAGGISVFLTTFPVLLLSYYEFPIYSFFLNLAVIPLMGLVMAFGVAALLAGIFWLPLGRLFFFPVHILLWCFEAGCRITMKLPGSQWIVGKPEVWQICLYACLVLLFVLLEEHMAKATTLLFLLGSLWILTGNICWKDSVTILDVGQGDGIVIQSREGATIMIDGGSSSESSLAEYTLIPYLKSQGISTLDYVFLSHVDEDHINGIETLLGMNAGVEGLGPEIKIGTLILPKLSGADETYMEMARLAVRAGTKVCTMETGDELTVKNMTFSCLHPKGGDVYEDRNEASMVLFLRIRNRDFTALFMGDLDGEAERKFAEQEHAWELEAQSLEQQSAEKREKVTLLKVGHHGAKTSSSEQLLARYRPKFAVISCGENNHYGHPAAETLERLKNAGSEVLTTPESGAITVEIGKDVEISVFIRHFENKKRSE